MLSSAPQRFCSHSAHLFGMRTKSATPIMKERALDGMDGDREFVGSFAKGLTVIRAFSREQPRLTVSQTANATQMTRAAARRLLLTLERLGYVTTDGKNFELAPKILELGNAYMASRGWLAAASPALARLRATLNESVSVTVLQDVEVIYVARFPATRVLTMAMEVGGRQPAYCTATGRVLLSDLPDRGLRSALAESDIRPRGPNAVTDRDTLFDEITRVRRQGYALVDQELEPGLIAVSVPLRNAAGTPLAAVKVCGHAGQLTSDDLLTRCLPALQAVVDDLTPTLL